MSREPSRLLPSAWSPVAPRFTPQVKKKMHFLTVADQVRGLLFVTSDWPHSEEPPTHEQVTNSYELLHFHWLGQSRGCPQGLGIRTLVLRDLEQGRALPHTPSAPIKRWFIVNTAVTSGSGKSTKGKEWVGRRAFHTWPRLTNQGHEINRTGESGVLQNPDVSKKCTRNIHFKKKRKSQNAIKR